MNNDSNEMNRQLAILEALRELTYRVDHAGKGFARTEPRHRAPVEHPTARRDEDLATV